LEAKTALLTEVGMNINCYINAKVYFKMVRPRPSVSALSNYPLFSCALTYIHNISVLQLGGWGNGSKSFLPKETTVAGCHRGLSLPGRCPDSLAQLLPGHLSGSRQMPWQAVAQANVTHYFPSL